MDENPTDLVGRFGSEEEEQKALQESIDAMERARELLKDDAEQNAQQPVQLVERIEPQKPIEKKKFLILFIGETEEGNVFTEWVVAIGREGCYKAITGVMESAYYLDLIESKIIAENKPINEAKNLYNYMSYIIENDLIPLKNGEFYPDLDDYLVGDIGEYDLADGLEVIEGGM